MPFKVSQAIEKYEKQYIQVERPDWNEYFLGLCFFIARRSEDANTRHGCILTDQNHHIIGTGYNSLPRGITPGLLPNTRPLKYQYMIHAEENALLNTTLDPWLLNEGGICYCTAKPCLRCLYRLWNKNIRTMYVADTGYHFQDYEKEQEDFDAFVEDTGINILAIKPNLEWLKEPMEYLQETKLIG